MAAPPSWLEVRQPVSRPDAALQRLGAGERDTLLLAQELQADLVLLDDREAHAEAARRGVPTFGTLRLLEMAAQRHLLDLPTALTALAATSFYVEESLVRDLLARDAARKRQGL
jgi:predicted nucleic acid-binding protein